MSSLVYVLIYIVSNSLLCDSASFDSNPLCKHDCGSLNEFFLHVTKNEMDKGDFVMTKFCFRLHRSDPGQGTWSWALTMTTHCLSLNLRYTMVKVHLSSKDGEYDLLEEFIYEQDTFCSTPSICNPWASDLYLIHNGTSGAVSVNVTKTIDVREVSLILKETKCNKTNCYTRTDKMKCEDELCSACFMDVPTGIYGLEVIPTCDEICDDLRACRPLYKEFAISSTSEGSAYSSFPSSVSTEVQTSQKLPGFTPVSSSIWTGVVAVSLVVFLAVTVTMVVLILRWRRNVHIRQDARVLVEEAVLSEALITQENNHILNHI
ncbi:hypothetical protein ACJMK2_016952 [Sinanodonta woodiana]|uniref:Uncharacterized protein n=1 Tax=Sinanodonta woodiana TaxID=1069815 RepID=A0ABD3UYS6_SINWO